MEESIPKSNRLDLNSAVKQLAQDATRLEPNDLPRLGLLLSRVNSIDDRVSEIGLTTMAAITRGLRAVIGKLIMGEVQDHSLAIDTINDGISLLQESQKNCGPEAAGVDPWKASVESLGVSLHGVETRERDVSVPLPSESLLVPTSDHEVYQDFVVEALEHLSSIEIHVINLEQNPEARDFIDSIFRAFHSIKGVSGFLNLSQINRFAHAIEVLLDGIRGGEFRVTPDLVDLVLSAVDQMKTMILDLQNSQKSGMPLTQFDLSHHISRIRRLQEKLSGGSPQERQPIGEILLEGGTLTRDDLVAALEKQKDHSEDRRIGEILIQDGKAKPSQVIQALRHQRLQMPPAEIWGGASEAIKVNMEMLDNLIDVVRKLLEVESTITQNPKVTTIRDQRLRQDIAHLGRLTSELQESVISLRTVPIGQIFQRMVRLVRDLSRRSGKRVDLRIEGGDTRIDRSVAGSLHDPLVHMIRNAVDHGIEVPEVRKNMGKSESGCISLRAFQNRENTVIEIKDDGRGLDRDRIMSRARERGLIGPGKAVAEKQIDRLIFYPGLSTSDTVTNVSGRGVGMDVVKRAVEKLHGQVEIKSKPGKGSVFTIGIPLRSVAANT